MRFLPSLSAKIYFPDNGQTKRKRKVTMITNAFPYRFFTNLLQQNDRLTYPSILKDIIKKRDLLEVKRLEDFFVQELQQASFETAESIDYFFFVTQEGLLTAFYRRDTARFNNQMEVVKHRLVALRKLESNTVSIDAWDQFLDLLEVGFQRLLKHTAIENFESHINKLDWSKFDESFIAQISNIIGFVYLNEFDKNQKQKGRIWLMKALGEFPNDEKLSTSLLMARYFIDSKEEGSTEQVEQILRQIKGQREKLTNKGLSFLHLGASMELEAVILALKFAQEGKTAEEGNFDKAHLQLKEFETHFAQEGKLPEFQRAKILRMIAYLYSSLDQLTDDNIESANLAKNSIQKIDQAIEILEAIQDESNLFQYRLEKAQLAIKHEVSTTEKDMKELLQFYKKRQDHPNYIEVAQGFVGLYVNNNSTRKSYDLIHNIFKLGQKKGGFGGFHLLYEGLELANRVFLRETKQPGVSWITEVLADFFEKVMETTEELESKLEDIGTAQIEAYRQACIRFEPISHFNIKVYFQYQLLEVILLRIGATINNDEVSLRVAEKLLDELGNRNNPLYFIGADWEEFKQVPNDVRNKTLNKCINISKGDLPAAAEHLDFSYRNLRSYITFKEVNRLGFFLDLQETNNRQLELGIRFMFYDLYKQGTIFEVVFDMPKFLVKYAKNGFYSQDLEEELNIKGTTAKKYIKIMMENGIIKQDRAAGRRHYYRLIRENIMNRLGKDQKTLIDSPQ